MHQSAPEPATVRFLARKLELTKVDRSAWRLDAWMQSGRRLRIEAFSRGDLVVLPPDNAGRAPNGSDTATMYKAVEQPATVTLQTVHGALRLRRAQAMEWLCLLAGLPLPGATADEGALRWRAALAATRMPSDVRKRWGPMSCNWADGDPADAANDCRLTLLLGRDGVHCYLDAWAPPGTWQRLLASFEPLPAQGIDMSLACTWRVRAGTCNLHATELTALEVGDALRLRGAFGVDGAGAVDLGAFMLPLQLQASVYDGVRTVWRAAIQAKAQAADDQRRVDTETEPLMESNAMAGDSESNTPSPDVEAHTSPQEEAPRSPGNQGGAGDDFRIELTAELGMLSMTLGELRNLRPGSMVAIRSRGPAEVTLYSAPNSPVAEGFLIDIDGQLGIEITRRIPQ